MKRRTPDAISKKRQQLRNQIVNLEAYIFQTSSSLSLTYEDNIEQEAKLKRAQLLVDSLKKELHNTQKEGRPFNLDFRKNLLPGVM